MALESRRQDEMDTKDSVSYTPLQTEDLDESRDAEAVRFLLHCDQPSLVNEKDIMLRKWLNSSSTNSNEEDDDEEEEDIVTRGGEVCCLNNIKVTGTCFCKFFVVLYLLTCLLVSALYIAIYGPSELYLMPERPPVYKPFKVSALCSCKKVWLLC